MVKVRMACLALAVVVASSAFAEAGIFGRFGARKSCGYRAKVVYYSSNYCCPSPTYVNCCVPQYVTSDCCASSSVVVHEHHSSGDCHSCSSSSIIAQDETEHSDAVAKDDEERPVDPKPDPSNADEEVEGVEKPKKLEEAVSDPKPAS